MASKYRQGNRAELQANSTRSEQLSSDHALADGGEEFISTGSGSGREFADESVHPWPLSP